MNNKYQAIASALKADGGLVAMSTDLGYVLAAKAADHKAVQRLYALIPDLDSNPGIIIGNSIDQLASLGLLRRYIKAYEQYWPGAVAVVIPSSDPSLAYLSQSRYGIIVCVPDDPALDDLLTSCGPLLIANIQPGDKDPSSSVDAYFEGPNLANSGPVTIIRVVDDAVEIIRPGSVIIRS